MRYDPTEHAKLRDDCYACRLTRIAAELDLNPSSIGKFFSAGGRLSRHTIERIRAAVRKVGYYRSPNPKAEQQAAYYRANKWRWGVKGEVQA